MLDFVFFGFLALVVIVLIWAMGGKSKKSGGEKSDAVLTVSGETKSSNKTSSGTYEYTYDDLKALAVLNGRSPEGADYFGPTLEVLFTKHDISYSSALFYSAGSKKVQRLLQRGEIKDWLVAIEKDKKPLSWKSDGPFLLLNEKDTTKRVPHLLRIEAK
jgi:hypothetical protein